MGCNKASLDTVEIRGPDFVPHPALSLFRGTWVTLWCVGFGGFGWVVPLTCAKTHFRVEFVPRLPAFAEKTSISERGFFWRKHARMQPKMCFPSHARHCFPSTAFSKFLRAPRGFRVRPRRRLFRVRIFQCRLRSTQASVFCPHSYFHASK